MSNPIAAVLLLCLALFLGALNLVLWVQAARRARRRRWLMRRHAMMARYPGAFGTGEDSDPYLRVWARALERIGQ